MHRLNISLYALAFAIAALLAFAPAGAVKAGSTVFSNPGRTSVLGPTGANNQFTPADTQRIRTAAGGICAGAPLDDPAAALRDLRALETQLQQQADAANAYAGTAFDGVIAQAGQSIITGTNLANAQDALAVQQFLFNFGSLLLDIASVSDFFEGLAKGDLSDNSLIQNIDSIYEAAKDGESAIDTLADNLDPSVATEGTGPINDAVGKANEALGTDGLTDLNSLKSDLSDVLNLIDDYKAGKPVNPRTIGQLVGRIAKGFAANDMAERIKRIKDLQNNLQAEQQTQTSIFNDYLGATNRAYDLMDSLRAVREAIRWITERHPAAIGGATGVSLMPGATTTRVGSQDVALIVAKCPECQSIADEINALRVAREAARQRIAAIEAELETVKQKKRELEAERRKLERLDRRLRSAREGVRSTDVPILGPSRKLVGNVQDMEWERRQLLNKIGTLERAIQIAEQGKQDEIEQLQASMREIARRFRDLRYRLQACEEEKCKDKTGLDTARLFSGLFGLDDSSLRSVELLDHTNVGAPPSVDPFDQRQLDDIFEGGRETNLGQIFSDGFESGDTSSFPSPFPPSSPPPSSPPPSSPPPSFPPPSGSPFNGTYMCDMGCGFGSVTFNTNGSMTTIDPLGVNGPQTFLGTGESGQSSSNNLILFGQPGHTCEFFASDFGSGPTIDLFCFQNPPGSGSCSELCQQQ